jgi:hypothetical protein
LVVFAHRQAKVLAEVPYSQVEDVEIGGPGLVKTGGRFVGGGFGVTGAVEGMAIAAVLNSLTTRTSVKTIVRIQGTSCELFLLHARLTPEQLRIAMSPPLGAIRSARATQTAGGTQHEAPAAAPSPVQELTKLADMLEKGLLTREEFDLMKAKLIGPPTIRRSGRTVQGCPVVAACWPDVPGPSFCIGGWLGPWLQSWLQSRGCPQPERANPNRISSSGYSCPDRFKLDQPSRPVFSGWCRTVVNCNPNCNPLIRRSMDGVRSVRRNPYPQVSVLPGVQQRRHSPAPSGQSVRKL